MSLISKEDISVIKFSIKDIDFPGWNECIKYAKMGTYGLVYANKKKEYTQAVRKAVRGLCPFVFEYVDIHALWIEPNRRKDPDNVACGIKFILDAFILERIILNDGCKQVKSITHNFEYWDRRKVEITLKGKKLEEQ
jgi:hypothetical protein